MDEHPIQVSPPARSAIERITYLEVHLAMLWDQVWWMQLSAQQRAAYEAEGFKAPIEKFYGN